MDRWKVTGQESGWTLMRFLQSRMQETVSLRQVKAFIGQQGRLVNGVVERFGSKKVVRGDLVALTGSLQKAPRQEFDQSRVLYEDEALLCYNKPPYLLSTDGGLERLLLDWDRSLIPVHRLDKDTSGVILFAKGASNRDALQRQFKERTVEKEYFAIVDGVPKLAGGVVEGRIGRVAGAQALWGPKATGLFARTRWRRLADGKRAALVLCSPETGRTHQIRVHMRQLGHALLGDFHYERSFCSSCLPPRHMLHASTLRFCHPLDDRPLSVAAPLPPDFVDTLKRCGIRWN